MDANICDTNQLDADVLLPPRKRLLAGYKKENSNGHGILDQASTSSDQPTIVSSSLPLPSTYSCSLSDFDTHLNSLLSSSLINANLSPEEILEASRSEAITAAKTAEAARATAEEKAAIAAKAIAAAKSALDLVTSLSEGSKDRHMKRNKMKKHVPVQLLYKKHQPVDNHRKDEELAQRLHRAMNSSPRISKSSSSECREKKSKRPKTSCAIEKAKASNGSVALGGLPLSTCNGHAIAGVIDSDDSVDYSLKTDAKRAWYEKAEQLELDSGEAESSNSKGKASGDTCSPGKKRGRVKLKKLPLSICSSRDRTNVKEGTVTRCSPVMEKNTGDVPVSSKPLFPIKLSAEGAMSVEATRIWKCQDFTATTSIKQNKIVFNDCSPDK